ncbi:DUF1963 domain-containing protein [Rubricoccus marinus]|nr:DUF1963 domain-containing protein [Rubricoccus marinus]
MIPDVLRPFLRTAWAPLTSAEMGPADASSFSGLAWIPEGETWPECPNCGRPLQLLAQLNTADLPEPTRAQAGTGLIQAFYCTNADPKCDVDLEGWAPFSDAHVVRRVVPSGVPALSSPPEAIPDRFPPRRITGWTAFEEPPLYEEAAVRSVELDDATWDALADDGWPRAGDKLGGWPHWVQSPERPACRRCGREMEVLLQLDSHDHLPIYFGDMGAGHLSVCPEHADVLAFGWACG